MLTQVCIAIQLVKKDENKVNVHLQQPLAGTDSAQLVNEFW